MAGLPKVAEDYSRSRDLPKGRSRLMRTLETEPVLLADPQGTQSTRAMSSKANVNRALPINFCGGPDEIVAQFNQCREQIGAGVVDLSFQIPGSEDPGELMEALELFGRKVLPHIRDI